MHVYASTSNEIVDPEMLNVLYASTSNEIVDTEMFNVTFLLLVCSALIK